MEVQLEFGKTFEMPLRVLQDVLLKSSPKHTAEKKEMSDDGIAAVRYFVWSNRSQGKGKTNCNLSPNENRPPSVCFIARSACPWLRTQFFGGPLRVFNMEATCG